MANLIGEQIDQYLIQKLIARGGMAEVYLATDVMLQRQVALKVMLSELAIDQTATARFRREAEAVARLNHPNIIQIYTTGVTPDNRPYLAMQYVPGGSLQQKLAELSRQGQQMSVGESLYLSRRRIISGGAVKAEGTNGFERTTSYWLRKTRVGQVIR
jgi:serine/threonine protein kinase